MKQNHLPILVGFVEKPCDDYERMICVNAAVVRLQKSFHLKLLTVGRTIDFEGSLTYVLS